MLAIQFFRDHLNSFGGASERATPVPFPNTEVKPLSADGTWIERPWESRSPPDFAPQTGVCGNAGSPPFFTFGSWVSRLRADPHNQNEKGPGGNPRAFPRFTPNHTHKTAGARQFRRSAPDWPLPLREAAVHDGSATWLPRQRSGAANQLPSGLCGWLGRRSRLHYGKYWPKLGHPRACRR